MDEKAKEARRAYSNAWRAANKDKVREYNQRYWKRKAEQMQKKPCSDSNSFKKRLNFIILLQCDNSASSIHKTGKRSPEKPW